MGEEAKRGEGKCEERRGSVKRGEGKCERKGRDAKGAEAGRGWQLLVCKGRDRQCASTGQQVKHRQPLQILSSVEGEGGEGMRSGWAFGS